MKKLLWAGVLAFGAYEFYALKTKEDGDTISELIWKWSRRPLVPFAVGMLVGHFVWQSQSVYDSELKKDICQIDK